MEQNPSGTNTSLFQLNIDTPAHFMLRSAASWSRVMAICGILMGCLFVILGIMSQNAANSPGGNLEGLFSDRTVTDREKQFAGTVSLVVFVIIGLIFLIAGIFAFNFSSKISIALRTNDPNTLRAGFAAARNYFAFRTIVLILCLLFLLLAIVSGNNQPVDNGRFD